MLRASELCRKLRPVLGQRIDRLWSTYLADDADGRSDIEQMLELLAQKHLKTSYEPDRAPFPPPSETFACAGDIPLGTVAYGPRPMFPFHLRSGRLREHVLIAGRSGSGKTNLTFVLMEGIMASGCKVLAIDWKRGYRDLLARHDDLRIYTIGREVAPLRFNPLIPPPGCEPHVWIKLIVDVIASAYLGGEGVISLLVGGLDHLYRKAGVFDGLVSRWPTIADLLVWLQTAKLKGRAAMWQASAQRILLAMCYGEFSAVINTNDNTQVLGLLDHNVVLEMDGLSSNSDRTMFSEALTLYLYRYRLAQGPRDRLTNMIILEEAHNLLLAKQVGSKESVLESSIRMIRQYGLGYVFVDQSASLLSKVAFANSYATLALSQKLSADVRAMSAAMNLTDEQKEALSTLPIGSAVVRLADEHPEPFLIRVPRCPIAEGSVTDARIKDHMARYYTDSAPNNDAQRQPPPIPVVSSPDNKKNNQINPSTISKYPPPPPEVNPEGSPEANSENGNDVARSLPVAFNGSSHSSTPPLSMSREEMRFLGDVAARPLSSTVSRYQRLHLSRRRGNAVRQSLLAARLIEPVTIATRSGQVILYQLSEQGRIVCDRQGIDPGPRPRASLEHTFWIHRATLHFEKGGYEVEHEHPIKGNGAVDLIAKRPGQRIAVEVETGKSKIKENIENAKKGDFDRLIVIATSPVAIAVCQRAIDGAEETIPVELWTWLDLS